MTALQNQYNTLTAKITELKDQRDQQQWLQAKIDLTVKIAELENQQKVIANKIIKNGGELPQKAKQKRQPTKQKANNLLAYAEHLKSHF